MWPYGVRVYVHVCGCRIVWYILYPAVIVWKTLNGQYSIFFLTFSLCLLFIWINGIKKHLGSLYECIFFISLKFLEKNLHTYHQVQYSLSAQRPHVQGLNCTVVQCPCVEVTFTGRRGKHISSSCKWNVFLIVLIVNQALGRMGY